MKTIPSAMILLAPDWVNTELKVKPPPKRNSTPHSVFSCTCFQLAIPVTQMTIAAESATILSKLPIGFGKPNNWEIIGLRYPPKIQRIATVIKMTKVKTRCLVMWIFSNSAAKWRPNLGLNTIYNQPIISGNKINMTGVPYISQSAKSKWSCEAAMALGGLPTSVPIPPMVAL